jgi:glycosyltransferase involved in cell wall biosynthesis
MQASAATASKTPATAGAHPIKLLMVAFHFPPIAGSSGYLRTLKFAKYLPAAGVLPTILTVKPEVYPAFDKNAKPPLPPTTRVERTFALDARRAFAIMGKSLSILSLPDRYWSWVPFGAAAGRRLARQGGIDALFSTYPIASAHLIGLILHRLTGKPWVADFRDPMWDEFTSAQGLALRLRQRIERAVLDRCSLAMVCTDAMYDLFCRRYPQHKAKLMNIPNGFDEEDFQGLEAPAARVPGTGPVRLLHSGLLEPNDRDPVPFFKAVKALCGRRPGPAPVAVDLIAPSDEDNYRKIIAGLGLDGVINILPWRPYRKSLEAMAAADILLLFQGPSCFSQVPAKLYEYMRAGRPILAVTPAAGETGKLVSSTGAGRVVAHDDPEAIGKALEEWVDAVNAGAPLPHAGPETILRYSRGRHAELLAARLHETLYR